MIKVFLLMGGLLITLVLIGRWWGANDTLLTSIRMTNERIESKVDILIDHDRDQEIRLRVLEDHQK